MKFVWTVILLVLLFASTMDARRNDGITKEEDIWLRTEEMHSLSRDTPMTWNPRINVYSYTVPGHTARANVLTFSISPYLKAVVDGDVRYADASLDLDTWNHICFTWSSANGQYRFYKDGMVLGGGSGMAKGHKIPSGGTTVIAQNQCKRWKNQAFVGDLTELNVWDVELSESDIFAQYQKLLHYPWISERVAMFYIRVRCSWRN